ncbi:MAG: DUF87 domain-containing protein [Candidatus Saccharibacteria bacterium]|nr:DUF87 domain-containing protein [Candidatus Saccharibacteria bacterium]
MSQTPTPDGTVLLLQVPRTNEKKELAAEQMLASLHGLLHGGKQGLLLKNASQQISFEIAVKNRRIGFYVWVPTYLKSYVIEQIYAQYPTVHITEISDYADLSTNTAPTRMAAEIALTGPSQLPIKTFPSFEVDPLAAITATLAQFRDDEEAWLQVIVRPTGDSWHKASERYIAKMRGGGVGLGKALWAPPEDSGGQKLAEHENARVKGAEEKAQKLAYDVCVRLVYAGNTSPSEAKMRLQSIIASYKQFNSTYLNGFKQKFIDNKPAHIQAYTNRTLSKSFILNIEEVASLFHLPHTNVETPNILWANAKTAEPPANLPILVGENTDHVSPLAATNFRGHHTPFGVHRSDRGRHLYIIGQTGVGKSALLELLTISDIPSPYGFAVIDPHGDYALNTLKRISPDRVEDVIYFNPADTDFPIAFNPMEVVDDKLKTHTASELIGVLKRMFESWGPRLEYILRYSLLALLDYPESTMLDITRILTDKKFRDEVLTYVDDPVVRNFWQVEFASWNPKFQAEAVAPVLNKVGAFTANPIVRNIIGQPKSSFNIRKIMDERKILIVNLSRGLIGEDNASLLGALLVTKIQMGAMSRADIEASERVPFYLYVDEFQNFATDSFATILSEARKYALNLTVANQYTAQMTPEVKDAVFGNVGSIITFRTSADDAKVMQKYFEPHFEDHDIVHMHNRHIAISMIIEGEKQPAFSATTLNLPEYGENHSASIIDQSRRQFAADREHIEAFMQERYGSELNKIDKLQKPPKKSADKPAPKPPAPEPKDQADTPPKTTRETKFEKEPTPETTAPKDGNKSAKSIIELASKETPGQPKKKRRRRRRRKKGKSESPKANQSTEEKPKKARAKLDDKKSAAKNPAAKPAKNSKNSDTLHVGKDGESDETVISLR